MEPAPTRATSAELSYPEGRIHHITPTSTGVDQAKATGRKIWASRSDLRVPLTLQGVEGVSEASRSLEYDVLVTEYRALRDEVKSRIEKQQEITNFAVAFIAAAAVAGAGLYGKDDLFVALRPYFPLASIVLSAFALMTLDHEMNIANIYAYIDGRLRPEISRVVHSTEGVRSDALGWGAYRSIQQQGSSGNLAWTAPIAASKYGMTIVPNLAFVTYLAVVSVQSWDLSVLTRVLYWSPVVIMIVVLAVAARVSSLYIGLSVDANRG
ncbi:hypothetical protein [Pseudonocardia sp. WMMC193]|uniref:hypothetical protein n=1 Tax=Pseudonocardia sp. WMMC193 TaxID=2911965 RepID=UPI001F399215|nr:hypothetical protein [Pseudonocardia sp. WMMC193]MCF7552174.1 hypothetical protein [Pseudonocardia sp. WMMC193]